MQAGIFSGQKKTGLKINITDNNISPKVGGYANISPKVGGYAYLIFILCRQVFFRDRKKQSRK